MDFKILADYGGDFRDEFLSLHKIDRIPMMITLDEKEIHPKSLDREEFFREMKEGKVFRTSQISVSTTREYFESYAKRGENLLYYAFSSGLSQGTPNAKVVMEEVKAEYPDFNALVWDSLNVTHAEEMVLNELIKHKDKFENFDEIKDYLTYIRAHTKIYFSVGEIGYLFRGGRLSKSSFIIGSALQIKPWGYVDDEGKLAIKEKARGFKNLNKKLASQIVLEKAENSPLYLGGGEDDKLKKGLSEELNKVAGREIPYEDCLIGPIILCHTGPQVLTISFFDTDINDYWKQTH